MPHPASVSLVAFKPIYNPSMLVANSPPPTQNLDSLRSSMIIRPVPLQARAGPLRPPASELVVSVGTPVIFWVFIGAGMGHSFHSNLPGGENFMEYFFPGTLVMMILFTAIFSTISIIEDRREGFSAIRPRRPRLTIGVVLGKSSAEHL